MTMHDQATYAPESLNHLYKPPYSSHLSEVFRKEFRMFYDKDGTLNADLAFDNIDHRLVDLSEIIAIVRDQLLEVPNSTTVNEIGSLLNGCMAMLGTVIPPFEALQVRFAELEQLAARSSKGDPS